MKKKLYRESNTMVSGVCAGLAHRMSMDPVLVRILMVLLTLASLGFFAFFYIALWAILPKSVAASPIDATADFPPVSGASTELKREVVPLGAAALLWVVATALCFLFGALVLDRFFFKPWWHIWPMAITNLGFLLMFVPLSRDDSPRLFFVGFLLAALGAFFLPFSFDVMSWGAAENALAGLWPLLLIACGLLFLAWGQDNLMYVFASGVVLVLFLVVALGHYGVQESAPAPAMEAPVVLNVKHGAAPVEVMLHG